MRRITRTLMAVVAVALVVSGSATAAITIIDGFEDGDIAEYSGDTGAATVVTSPVYEGNESLEISSGNGGIGSTSGLPDYPERGDTFRYRIQHDSAVGTTNSLTGFAMQSEGNPGDAGSTQGYLVVLEGQNDVFELWLDDFETVLVSEGVSIPQDEWLEVVVDWGNPTITVTLYDSAGTQLAQIQADDSTYNTGGVAMGAQGADSNTAYWDNVALGTASTPTPTATTTATPTDGNETGTPVDTDKKNPGEIWESFLVFVGFIVLLFAALGGLGSRSMAVGATSAYVVFGYIAVSTGNVLLTNILYVTVVLVIIGMALKMWRMEFGGEI